MRIGIKLAGGLALVCSTPAVASDTAAGAIGGFLGMSNGAVLFYHSGTRTTPPSCQYVGGETRWALDASTLRGQSQLSVLLTAHAMGKHIIIHGTGVCSIWGDTETVDFFAVSD